MAASRRPTQERAGSDDSVTQSRSGSRSAPKKASASGARKVAATKASPTKAAAKAAPAKKGAAKKSAAKKAPAKKAPAKKAPAKKAPAKKSATTKTPPSGTTATKRAVATKTTTTKKSVAQKSATKQTSRTPAPSGATTTGTTAVTDNNTLTTPKAASLVVGANEDPWTEEELAEVTAELQADLRRHEEQAAAVREDLDEMRHSADTGGDAADVGTSNFERDQELALAAHAHEAVRQTRLALDRIAEGTWGQCAHCGEPIGKGRLQVYPRATLCMTCKKREERR